MATRKSSRKRKNEPRPMTKVYLGMKEDPPGFEVKPVNDYIGSGVFATSNFYKDEFLLEYKGVLIKDMKEATTLEKSYEDNDLGCFMYFFKYRGKQLCIDATHDTIHQGRMVNDAKTGQDEQNCRMKIVEQDGKPHLCLFSARQIAIGEELRFDYGVSDLPWRKNHSGKKRKDHPMSKSAVSSAEEEEAMPVEAESVETEDEPTKHLGEQRKDHPMSKSAVLSAEKEEDMSVEADSVETEDEPMKHLGEQRKDHPLSKSSVSSAEEEEAIPVEADSVETEDEPTKHLGEQRKDHSMSISAVSSAEEEEAMPLEADSVETEDEPTKHLGEQRKDHPMSKSAVSSAEEEETIPVEADSVETEDEPTKHLGEQRKDHPMSKSAISSTEEEEAIPVESDSVETEDEPTVTVDVERDTELRSNTTENQYETDYSQEFDSDDNDPDYNIYLHSEYDSESTENGQISNSSDIQNSDSDVSCEILVQPNLGAFLNNHIPSTKTIPSSDTAKVNLFPKGQKKKNCKQIYDKVNYCTYCGKAIKSKISRHLLNVHKCEKQVSDIINLPKKTKSRKVHLEVLANEGNFKHNINVLKQGKGYLVVGRRESRIRNMKQGDYLPCEYCKKFIMKETLWLHHKNCTVNKFFMEERNEKNKGRSTSSQTKTLNNAIRHARSLLNSALLEQSDHLLTKLFDRMQSDDITEVVKHDNIIKKYAVLRVESLGSPEDQKINDIHRVSQGCRTLARLVIRCRQINSSSIISLDKLVTTEHFDLVVSSTKSMCNDKKDCSVSLGRNIGNLLAHVIQIKKGDALRQNSRHRLEQAENFQRLYDSEWNFRINSVFQKRANTLNRQKVKTIPLTGDLQKLREHIITCMKSLSESLKVSKKPEDWTQLAKYTICRLILFNKRRRAEVKDLKLQEYQNRPNWMLQQQGEFEMALSTSDKMLAKRMDMVISAGKSRKNVDAYVILPPDCKNAIDLLNSLRDEVGVPFNNPYIFARRNSNSPLSGHTDLKEIVGNCPGLIDPEKITSTSLRKYIATVSQILDMTDPELSMLAKHLGHDVKTHKENYRLSHSTRELTVVSQLLMAVDSGCVNKWKGRNLKDISLNELPSLEQNEFGNDLQSEEIASVEGNEPDNDIQNDETPFMENNDSDDDIQTGVEKIHCLDNHLNAGTANLDKVDEPQGAYEVNRLSVPVPRRGRQIWTAGESSFLKKKFSQYLRRNDSSVHKSDIVDAQEECPALQKRTIAQIRVKLNNFKLGKNN